MEKSTSDKKIKQLFKTRKRFSRKLTVVQKFEYVSRNNVTKFSYICTYH